MNTVCAGAVYWLLATRCQRKWSTT